MRLPLAVSLLALALGAAALVVALTGGGDESGERFFEVELRAGGEGDAFSTDGLTMSARCTDAGVATLFRAAQDGSVLTRTIEFDDRGQDRTDHASDRDFGPGDTGLDIRAVEGPYQGMAVFYTEDPDDYAIVHWHAWREDDGRCELAGAVG